MKKTALAFAIALALFGCKSTSTSARIDDQNATATVVPKGPAPEFDLENIAGGKLKSADLKGKIAVIDMWATWCGPCKLEIPRFNKLTEDYKDKKVQIVGITIESPYADIKPTVQETGIKYSVLVGNDAVVDGFGGVFGFPTTFIVTPEWKIYKKYLGAQAEKDERIRKDIEKLLAQQAASD